MSATRQILVFLLLVAVAAGMRFYRLGDWSFGFDELFTTLEVHILMGEQEVPAPIGADGKPDLEDFYPEDSQLYRLPRIVPVAYFIHWVDYKLFGEDEFGSRVLMAAVGSLTVGLVFLLAGPLFGPRGAVLLSLLILPAPEHLLASQCNRFYAVAFLFIAVLFLLGGHVAKNRSMAAAVWMGPVAVLMVLSHSLGGLVWGAVLVGLLSQATVALGTRRDKATGRTIPGGLILIVLLWSVVLLGIALFHIIPLASGWNERTPWGYTPVHAVLAFVNKFTWPMLLIALGGLWLLLAEFRKNTSAYWAGTTIFSGLMILVLPLKITYNPLYSIVFMFPFFVCAALLIDRVCRLLVRDGTRSAALNGAAWIVLCLLLPLPSLAGYYQDGDRPNIRGAFHYVDDHWQPGDRVAGFQMGAADYYLANKGPRFPLSETGTVKRLRRILDDAEGGDGRLWIVLHYHRGGLPEDLRRWLGRHARYEIRYGKKRWDYPDNYVDVYLVDTNGEWRMENENAASIASAVLAQFSVPPILHSPFSILHSPLKCNSISLTAGKNWLRKFRNKMSSRSSASSRRSRWSTRWRRSAKS